MTEVIEDLMRRACRSWLEELWEALNYNDDKRRWLRRISTYKYIRRRHIDKIYLYDHRPRTRIYLFIPYRRIQRPGDSD